MKNGNYAGWNESENKRRSERLCEVLARARELINAEVRGAYLKGALGGKKIKSKTVVKRKLRIDGRYTDNEEIQISETESELPPNIQALSTWLYHHDPEWRKIQRGEEPEDEITANGGISIDKWIKDNTE